ncbi:hypothetical protein MVEN_02602900 [Mycena venus]|uniref:Uncharacterized protein n=1 Tax=Mycena venus TaxID=2733690 RepID=A0A8H6WT49_9AGAR|nr:hypothetical protein MVEN_02602900 [Mycena venus]
MLTSSSSDKTSTAYSTAYSPWPWAALRIYLQLFLGCFGFGVEQPQGERKETFSGTHHASYCATYSPIEYLRRTYIARIVARHFRVPVALPSNSGDLAPLSPDALSAAPRTHLDYRTTYPLLHGIIHPLLELYRRSHTPSDISHNSSCGCPSETGPGCSPEDHACAPCPCPNDYRLEKQTSNGYHSLYCIKCGKTCYACVGTGPFRASDVAP